MKLEFNNFITCHKGKVVRLFPQRCSEHIQEKLY